MDEDAPEKASAHRSNNGNFFKSDGSKHTDNGSISKSDESNYMNNDSFSKSEDLSPCASEARTEMIYEGPVYHVGVNRVGHHFCHPRFLRIYGTFVEMYKKEPTRGQKPIRQGVVSEFLKIEDLGRRRFDGGDLYVLKISNALDNTTKGEIACKTASDAQNWRNAFLQAKDEVDAAKLQKGSGHRIARTDEFNLSGHRPRLRRYARDLTKLIRIGNENLHQSGGRNSKELGLEMKKGDDDALDELDWRCVRTVNGIRILEDVTVSQNNQKGKFVILKAVGVVEASPGAVFEMLIDVQNPHRKEWDILTGDLKLVEQINGHRDIVYGTFDPKYVRRWNSKRDFLFSRFWRIDPDNSYAIFQSSTKHRDYPKKRGFRRIKLNTTTWEIKPLPFNIMNSSKSLVTQTMEIQSTGWGRWRKKYFAKLDETMPYIVLCQIAGLRDYFASNPVTDDSVSTVPNVRNSTVLGKVVPSTEIEDVTHDEFYDALAAVGGEEEEDSDEEEQQSIKFNSHRFKNIALGLSALTLRAKFRANELVSSSSPVEIILSHFKGSLPMASGIKDSHCWTDPGGREFMVRGKTYSRDYQKVSGGDPLLKLLAVDWLQSESRIDAVATNKNSLVQSEAGKKVPFLLAINLQVPATPNYSLVFYFGATNQIREGSLLDQFVNGSDAYRDSRFKLIPRIVEGYWFVKRAVGTKACLLGKAVTCHYIRQENFLEIDVDIGSSSVARSIINLVLGHITNLVVDMAILIEGRDEAELPEYLLGTTRVSRVELEFAKPYEE